MCTSVKWGEGNAGRTSRKEEIIQPPKRTRRRTKTHRKKPNKQKEQCEIGNNSKYVSMDGILTCEFIS